MVYTDQLGDPLLCISWGFASALLSALPLFSFFLSVIIAIVWHFENSTWTHCEKANYLPSISAAVGGNMPEKFIWRVGIALHCLPRIIVATCLLHNHHKNSQSGRVYNSTTWWFKWLNRLASVLNTLENGALLTLTYVSSSENFDVHEKSFVVFMACAICYMPVSCVLFKLTATQPMPAREAKIMNEKIYIMLFNYCSFAMALVCYFRHNWYCEAGVFAAVYTVFAVFEYCTIVSNIVFHWHCHKLFSGLQLCLAYRNNDVIKVN